MIKRHGNRFKRRELDESRRFQGRKQVQSKFKREVIAPR